MPSARSFSVSKDFCMTAEIKGVDSSLEPLIFVVTADYEVEVDDPAYNPRSGNSLTATWYPDTSISLDDVAVDWADDTEDVSTLLTPLKTKSIELRFSADHDEGFTKDGEDIRPRLSVNYIPGDDILVTYDKDIEGIAEGFAECLEVDVDEI